MNAAAAAADAVATAAEATSTRQQAAAVRPACGRRHRSGSGCCIVGWWVWCLCLYVCIYWVGPWWVDRRRAVIACPSRPRVNQSDHRMPYPSSQSTDGQRPPNRSADRAFIESTDEAPRPIDRSITTNPVCSTYPVGLLSNPRCGCLVTYCCVHMMNPNQPFSPLIGW